MNQILAELVQARGRVSQASPSVGGYRQSGFNRVEKPFAEVLREKVSGELKFSAHAVNRLHSRNINMTPAEISKLNETVQKAADKGSSNSLIVMKDMAFVVSIKNKTVVTAMDTNMARENLFTNIDSAIFV